jgi:hypothetical protein
MQTAMRLCIKDLQHRWPYILALELLIVFRAVLDILLPIQPMQIFQCLNISGVLMWPLIILLTALVVQSDPLVGDRQFWLTRPITWRSLLAGKIMFLFCTINLPVLILQSAALIANNLSPFDHLSTLCRKQLLLALILLIVVSLASVARSLAQLIVAAIGIYALNSVLMGLMLFPLILAFSNSAPNWGSAENVRIFFCAVPLILTILFLIWLQYSKRKASRLMAIMLFSFSLIAFSLVPMDLWRPLALFRARMTGLFRSQSPVAIELRNEPSYRYKGVWPKYESLEDTAGIALPVRITGIPKGQELINEYLHFFISAPDGSNWESGWVGICGVNTTAENPALNIVPLDGEYSLTALINLRYYKRVQKSPVHVRASLAFRLYGLPIQTKLPQNKLISLMDGKMRCGQFQQQNLIQPVCIFGEAPSIVLNYNARNLSFAPSSNITTIWDSMYLSGAPTPSEALISIRQEEAWFETTLDIPEIQLSNYFYPKIKP